MDRLTVTVPQAGELLGIGRNKAYEAAKTGEIPTIRIGKRLLVPLPALKRLVSADTSDGFPHRSLSDQSEGSTR
jgi:excisionase family DNA binding protein